MNQTIELLTLLYELSLTNQKHLIPEQTAKQFIKKFLSRQVLQYGAVWKLTNYLEDEMLFERIYSMPQAQPEAKIKMEVFSKLFSHSEHAVLEHSIIEGVDMEGKFAYFKLGDFGLLELYTSDRDKARFTKDGFYPFLDVVLQFATSLESGYSYQMLQSEIKQRQIAEASQKNNEEKYRRIIDNIKLGLLEVDNDEIIRHANKPFLDLTGYSLEEVIGKNASDLLLSEEDKAQMESRNQSRQDGRSESYEIKIKDKSGAEKWAIVSGAPNYDEQGKLIGSIGIHLDITEEKNLKEENQFKDTQLKRIYEKSLDAMISIDQEGKIFEWSPQAQVIFGFTQEEVLHKSLSKTIVPGGFRKAHDEGMKHFINTGEGPVLNSRIEISGLRKSGEEFPIELTIFPLEFRDKHYFTAFVRDISEIKKSEENMVKALERQKELNNMKSQFISMTSHELRTPLTTIKTNTEIANYLLDNSDTPDTTKLKKNITRIEGNVERLNQLISNILMIGQVDSQKVPFNPQMMEVYAYISQTILPDFVSRGEQITCKQTGEPYEVLLDKRLISHILVNLIENAIKYSPGAKSPEILVNYDADKLEISVKDHGMGIPEEDIGKLFDTFYRASNVGNIQGTGLGLAIVSQFVKIHGGEITVTSEVNKGTTFSVFFPRETKKLSL